MSMNDKLAYANNNDQDLPILKITYRNTEKSQSIVKDEDIIKISSIKDQ